MKKEYRVMWWVWDEVIEAYIAVPANNVIHSTKEAAKRERAEMLEDPQYAGESLFVKEVDENGR